MTVVQEEPLAKIVAPLAYDLEEMRFPRNELLVPLKRRVAKALDIVWDDLANVSIPVRLLLAAGPRGDDTPALAEVMLRYVQAARFVRFDPPPPILLRVNETDIVDSVEKEMLWIVQCAYGEFPVGPIHYTFVVPPGGVAKVTRLAHERLSPELVEVVPDSFLPMQIPYWPSSNIIPFPERRGA